ncbi:MAG: SEC-C metal-binding domain-containing protein [Gemmataceae bacterium]
MRLAEDKIKEAILHPDREIRERAVRYFTAALSDDPDVMPLVIRAVETYGWEECYALIARLVELRQSEETAAWVVRSLDDPGLPDSVAFSLSRVPVEADPALFLAHEPAVLAARHFRFELRETFTERLRTLAWDEATCWQKLEEFCAEAGAAEDIGDVSFEYANHLGGVMGRFGRQGEGKIVDLLSRHADHSTNNPMQWMEPILCVAAGRARLESAVPHLVAKLHQEVDYLSEDCTDALIRIGTPAVVEAVAEAYPAAGMYFRVDAIAVLEQAHSDLAVEKCVELLGLEQDREMRRSLAEALLGQFAREGIEAARQQLAGRDLDLEDRELRSLLLETCGMMGETFPEYEQWKETDRAEREAEERRRKAFAGSSRGRIEAAVERFTSLQAGVPPGLMMPAERDTPAKAGRNDPCPCGSGKKYKKCCLK